MPPALPVVRIIGSSKVGKTTLAERLVGAFAARGYLVAAVKHSHHAIPADGSGTDTARLTAAGAGLTMFCGADGGVLPVPMGGQTLPDVLSLLTGRADVLVAEGYKKETQGLTIRFSADDPAMVIIDTGDGERLGTVRGDDVAEIATTLERLFLLSAEGSPAFRAALRKAAAYHGHLCPGQILGVRLARAGLRALGVDPPDPHDLFVAVEIDRCATDAIASVTGCSPGKRNLRIHDYGTVAATFLDTRSGQAVRVLAREPAREEAPQWAPAGLTSYRQQAIAYRRMPDEALFEIRAVRMEPPDRSRPPRQACDACGETVNFGRYVSEGTSHRCIACEQGTYYAGIENASVVEGAPPDPQRVGQPLADPSA